MNTFPPTETQATIVIGRYDKETESYECTVECDFQEDGLPLSEHDCNVDATVLFFLGLHQGGPTRFEEFDSLTGKEFILTP